MEDEGWGLRVEGQRNGSPLDWPPPAPWHARGLKSVETAPLMEGSVGRVMGIKANQTESNRIKAIKAEWGRGMAAKERKEGKRGGIRVDGVRGGESE
jgi:hypothetical protein